VVEKVKSVPRDYLVTPKAEGTEIVDRFNAIEAISKKKKKLDFNKIPLDDQKTWKLIQSGMTKGVFQLEKQLGKRYCKEIAPRNINELSDVLSLIRPGCLEAEFREKPETPGEFSSITHTYIKVKDGTWEPEYIHPVLEPIFSETYSVPIYQEQIMRICSDFAGFTLQEADVARKAVGKKKADVMAKVKINFLDGAEKNGHTKELAETIFSWIEKFSGYGFNKSHGVAYALIAYKTAYAKANYPAEFFRAMLANSDGKQDSLEEIEELVHEARYFNIEVYPPRLDRMNIDFEMDERKNIYFGLSHIKGVGSNATGQLQVIKTCKTPGDFLVKCFSKSKYTTSTGKKRNGITIKSNVAEALIKSGCLDYLDYPRVKLLAQYKLLKILTERERKFVFEKLPVFAEAKNPNPLKSAYQALLDSKVPNKSRRPRIIEAVDELNRSLAGNPKRMCIAYEKHLLGIPLSGSLVELYDNPKVNIKLKNLPKLPEGTKGAIGVVIEKVKLHKDKNHNQMAFLTVSDDTYFCDGVVVFASYYNKIAWIIEEGRPVLITGKKNRGSFLARDISHL